MAIEIKPIKLFIPIRERGSWDSWFSDNAIIVLAAIAGDIMAKYPEDVYVNVSSIAMNIFNTHDPSTEQRTYIKNGFDEICKINSSWVAKIEESDLFWKINTSALKEMDGKKYQYVPFHYTDVMDIIHKFSKSKLVYAAFYLKFLSIFDYRYEVCYFSQKYMADIMGVTKTTIQNRLRKLEKYKMIYSYHPYTENYINYNKETNVYFLPGGFDKAEKYLKENRNY